MQEIKELEEKVDKLDNQQDINFEEFERIYRKMHTPWRRRHRKISRNEVCPFCDSGKKFKKCECYEKYINTPIYTISYENISDQ